MADILTMAGPSGIASNGGAGGQHILCGTTAQWAKLEAALRTEERTAALGVARLKIMPVTRCDNIGKCQSSPSGYASYMESSRYSHMKPTAAAVAAYAMQQLEAARAKDVAAHEANLPAIENNKALADAVMKFMADIGMPGNHSERDTSSRARFPKSRTVASGYIGDLSRHVITFDGFDGATLTYERMKKDYSDYAARVAREAEEAASAAQRERDALTAKRKADMELAAILLRYSLDIESDWRDVLDALCQRDQRLNLAVAMLRTRQDWNEGCYRVTDALGSFSIHTDEDKDIAACVAAGTVEFDDGRVFRDMAWNYDAIFASIADQQLVADAKLALANGGD